MAQTLYKIAKTQQALMEQRFLDDTLGSVNDNALFPVIYRGKTVNATPAEIFVGGKAQTGAGNIRRIYLPESSFLLYEAYALAYNSTDNTVAHACKYYGSVQNLAGSLTSPLDYDLVTGGNQGFVKDGVIATVAQGINYQPSSTAVSFGTTGTALTVTVTGIAAKTVFWKVYLIPYTIAQTTDLFYGDAALGLGQ